MRFQNSIFVSISLIVVVLIVSVVTYILSQGPCPRGAYSCDGGRKCVLQRAICDGRRDCADGQDEDAVECGMYHGSIDFTLGVLMQTNNSAAGKGGGGSGGAAGFLANVSNGVDCALHSVPRECICKQATALICQKANLSRIPRVSKQVTSIFMRYNRLRLHDDSLDGLDLTQNLHLKNNRISFLPPAMLRQQSRLRKLYLDDNRIAHIAGNTFEGLHALEWLTLGSNHLETVALSELHYLQRLQMLNLSQNQLHLRHAEFPVLPAIMEIFLDSNRIESVERSLFAALDHLQFLSMCRNRISSIAADAFDGLKDLRELKLSSNRLRQLDSALFRAPTKLDALFIGFNDGLLIERQNFWYTNLSLLNLDGIPFENLNFDAIRDIRSLKAVVFWKFFYCSETANVRKCRPNTDGVSSLKDLLTKPVLRYSTWFMATLALLGNTLVLWGRMTCHDDNRAVSLVIMNLAVADLLMGVYLVAIGLEDFWHRDEYHRVSLDWIGSWRCTGIGMMAMVSCEVSLLILTFMSIERFLLIADPFRKARPRIHASKVLQVMVMIWVMGITLSVVPVIRWRSSTRYYGTYSGMCFPLHLQDRFPIGWQYSAFVFLGINLVLLMVIAVLYTALLISIWRTRKATEVSKFDFEFAIRFFFIVFTDGMCWAPIMATKLLVFFRYEISPDFCAWLVVFVLPLNSAINPMLYTFTTPKYRKQVLTHGWNKINTRRDAHKTDGGSLTSNPDDSQGKILPLMSTIGSSSGTRWKW